MKTRLSIFFCVVMFALGMAYFSYSDTIPFQTNAGPNQILYRSGEGISGSPGHFTLYSAPTVSATLLSTSCGSLQAIGTDALTLSTAKQGDMVQLISAGTGTWLISNCTGT